jgi:hypothetical protein
MPRGRLNLLHLGLGPRLILAAGLVALVWGATLWALP